MTARQIKWRIYWNFIKLIKRWPIKPVHTISKSGVCGIPVRIDSTLERGQWYLDAAIKGELPPVMDWNEVRQIWEDEHKHPSKETGQFDYIDWPEDD